MAASKPLTLRASLFSPAPLSPQHQAKLAGYLKERKANPHANGTSSSKANNRSITQLLCNSGFYSKASGWGVLVLTNLSSLREDGFWIKDGKMCPLWGRLPGGTGCSRVGAEGPSRAGSLCSCRSVSKPEPVGSQGRGAGQRGGREGWGGVGRLKNPGLALPASTSSKGLCTNLEVHSVLVTPNLQTPKRCPSQFCSSPQFLCALRPSG